MKIYSRYILFRALKWFVFMQFLSISIVLFFPIIQSVASGLPLSVTLAILPHFLPQEIANSAPDAVVHGRTTQLPPPETCPIMVTLPEFLQAAGTRLPQEKELMEVMQ